MAMRWSRWVATAAPDALPRPLPSGRPRTTSEASPSSQSTPLSLRPVATAARRSLSLTRSSSRPFITVAPSAKAAATARTGYSSIIDGARSSGTVTPLRDEERTRRSATSSPPARRGFMTSISAPISCSVRIRPVRVGFISTLRMVTSEPGTRSAATSGKAVEDGSPGTSITWPVSLPRPSRRIVRTPSASVSTVRFAPKPCSIFSVWSRVITGSMTVVMPGVLRPARRTADFTCAEAIGTR